MGASSRRFAWLGAIAFVSVSGAFAACGLDESGALSPDASVADAVADTFVLDTYVETAPPPPPLSCEEAGTSLDAACLGVPIPDGGWQPIGFQQGNVGCGQGVYSVQLVKGDIQLANGACTCTGCNVQGAWTCNASVGSGVTCGTSNSVNGFQNTCLSTSDVAFGETLTRTGNASCVGGSQVGNKQTTSDTITMCFPGSCSDDYCGLAKLGFKLCVYNPNVTDGTCPANFPVSQIVGQAPVVVCNACNACALANPSAACTGAVYAFDDAGCTGNVLEASTTSGACVSLGTITGDDEDAEAGSPIPVTYQSLFFEAGATPVPQCAPASNVTDGSIVINGAWTICCTN